MKKQITKISNLYKERWALARRPEETIGKLYYFSDYGRLKSVDKETGTERLLGGSYMTTGFHQLNITLANHKQKGQYVHKLIAEEWIEKDHEDQKFVVHLDRDFKNNFYMNLKWMSRSEMAAFHAKLGVFDPQKRKRNPHYKLNPSKIRLLRKKLKEGKTKKKIIAKQFGITIKHLYKIESGEMWAWVKDTADSNVNESSN